MKVVDLKRNSKTGNGLVLSAAVLQTAYETETPEGTYRQALS